MKTTMRWRLLALVGVFALVAASCGDDDEAGDTTTAAPVDTTAAPVDTTAAPVDTTAAPVDTTAAPAEGDGVLRVGTLLPETGDLAFLGPPEFAGADLAALEINDAGGVLGAPIELIQGDSGDTNTDIANQTTDQHLAAGVDAIVGAASSGVSFTVIDKITGANVIHFSPANTSPDFTEYPDNGLYFRTAPSDVLQGRVLADAIVDDLSANVVILTRQDPYGEGLLQFTSGPLQEAGVAVTEIVYDPSAAEFAAEVQQAVSAAPDAVVIIGFAETEQIGKELISQGLGPQEVPWWFVDGNIGNSMGENFDDQPGVLAGVRGTLPTAELTEDFRGRLLSVDPALTDFSYGPETYDAIVIIALAAEVAGSDFGPDVAAQINDVTRGGEKCTTFADCKALIEAGTDIDYDGVGGPYEFGDAGEPSEASFAIFQYGDDNRLDDSLTEYRFAAI
jgi:branched-chain amino acid transport system substrate-binding protein